jgi:predicted ATPase
MLKLKSVEIKESRDKHPLFIGNANLNDFNLLISDNAQGKTRFFSTISYLSSVSYNREHALGTNFYSKWQFEEKKSSDTDTITYIVRVEGLHNKNNYHENVYKNNKIVYSSSQSILIDEGKKEGRKNRIENFYLPSNTSAIASITEPKFRTIGLIRNFFQRVIFISANKSRSVHLDPNSIIPNAEGTNIGSVLSNWNTRFPHLFNEVIKEFRNRYKFINKVYFTDQETKEGIRTKLLTFDEEKVNEPITQIQWSDGMYRMLILLMSAKVPFLEGEKTFTPSLVLIDEVENGLDYKSLKFILDYFKDYSEDFQFILSSHSPLVCELIHPKHWIIVKRKGSEIKFVSPGEIVEDLDLQLELFKQKHWDFYTKHITNSDIYQ